MTGDVLADPDALCEQVRARYREVALDLGASFHFHTGTHQPARLRRRCGRRAA